MRAYSVGQFNRIRDSKLNQPQTNANGHFKEALRCLELIIQENEKKCPEGHALVLLP